MPQRWHVQSYFAIGVFLWVISSGADSRALQQGQDSGFTMVLHLDEVDSSSNQATATVSIEAAIPPGKATIIPLPFRVDQPPRSDRSNQSLPIFHTSAGPGESIGYVLVPRSTSSQTLSVSVDEAVLPLTKNGRASSGDAVFVGLEEAFSEANVDFPQLRILEMRMLTIRAPGVQAVDPPVPEDMQSSYRIEFAPPSMPPNVLLLLERNPSSQILLKVLAVIVLFPGGLVSGLVIPVVRPQQTRWLGATFAVATAAAVTVGVLQVGVLGELTLLFLPSSGIALGYTVKSFRIAAEHRTEQGLLQSSDNSEVDRESDSAGTE